MRRQWLFISAIVCFSAIATLAEGRANFSGSWVMDKNRSFNNPPGLEQTLTVKHEGDTLTIESKLVTAQGDRVVNESYTANGKEEEIAPPPNAPPNSKGKRKTSWLPDGQRLIVDETVVDGNGKVLNQTVRKWTLSSDGKTLTIDYYIDNSRNSYEAKRIFTKT